MLERARVHSLRPRLPSGWTACCVDVERPAQCFYKVRLARRAVATSSVHAGAAERWKKPVQRCEVHCNAMRRIATVTQRSAHVGGGSCGL